MKSKRLARIDDRCLRPGELNLVNVLPVSSLIAGPEWVIVEWPARDAYHLAGDISLMRERELKYVDIGLVPDMG